MVSRKQSTFGGRSAVCYVDVVCTSAPEMKRSQGFTYEAVRVVAHAGFVLSIHVVVGNFFNFVLPEARTRTDQLQKKNQR